MAPGQRAHLLRRLGSAELSKVEQAQVQVDGGGVQGVGDVVPLLVGSGWSIGRGRGELAFDNLNRATAT